MEMEMQSHLLVRIFWAKLIRFGQICLDLSKIKRNLGKID